MAVLITGAAGFIGSNLVKALIARGGHVVGFDNLGLGCISNLESVLGHPQFNFEQIDLSDIDVYREALMRAHADDPITEVWHMAANSDIPAGISDVRTDLRDTFMTTFNTLEVMRELGICVILFASSSAIYGDRGGARMVEDTGPLLPISNYGAMKLASEAAISAATESFISHAFIFRFPNVIGTPATHGVILDFVRKLKASPGNLVVLGDGTQRKSYLHVEELIDAMIFIRERADGRINVFNIGAGDNGVTVRFIAEQVVAAVSHEASITYGKGNKGWVGDVPEFAYSIEKLRALGWEPRLSSTEAVRRAVREIVEQEATI